MEQSSWTLKNVLSEDSDKDVFCYFKEVTFGPYLSIGTGCQENKPYN